MWRTVKIIQGEKLIIPTETQTKTIRSGIKEKTNGGGIMGVVGRLEDGIYGDNERGDME